MKALKITYNIEYRGEVAAGIRPFDDEVTVTVESGDPGGDDGEFARFLQECLGDWYDGANIEVAK